MGLWFRFCRLFNHNVLKTFYIVFAVVVLLILKDHPLVEYDSLKLGERFVDQFLHGVIRGERHLRMAVNDHSLTCADADALTGFHTYYLKSAKSFHLHLLTQFKVVLDVGEKI